MPLYGEKPEGIKDEDWAPAHVTTHGFIEGHFGKLCLNFDRIIFDIFFSPTCGIGVILLLIWV